LNRKIILHITTGLRRGGAEMMLIRILRAFGNSSKEEHVIVSLMPGNDFADEHRQAGIRVINLNMHATLSAPMIIMVDMGAEKRKSLGRLARNRMENLYSFEETVRTYLNLYVRLLNNHKK
jgi:hypothetical protein